LLKDVIKFSDYKVKASMGGVCLSTMRVEPTQPKFFLRKFVFNRLISTQSVFSKIGLSRLNTKKEEKKKEKIGLSRLNSMLDEVSFLATCGSNQLNPDF